MNSQYLSQNNALFLLIFLSLIGNNSFAQSEYPNIKIFNSQPFYPPCEPSIAIDRTNPSRMVAGAVLNHVAYSIDSGKTWQSRILNSKFGVFGDPSIISGEKGIFYYFHLSNPTGLGWSSPALLDRIVCQTSKKSLRKWSRGSGVGLNHPKDQDKEWGCWDPIHKKLILTWTQFDLYGSADSVHRSNILLSQSDDGKNWSSPIKVNENDGGCLDDSRTTEGATPAVGPNGEWYVSWSVDGKIYFEKSLDQGVSWLSEDVVVVDSGAHWSFDIPGIERANGMPVIQCDRSNGMNRGDIYINWADQRMGETDTDIWLSKSKDGGTTWSAPIRVNNDDPGKHQFFTWMDIDQSNGFIYTVFYDRRNYSDTKTDVYLAISKDGGQTFTNVRVSESPFEPNPSVFFGDYNNISAVNGVIRPIWTRSENGRQSVWTALVNIK